MTVAGATNCKIAYNALFGKKCFELTYQYKEANDFFYEGYEYKWDDSMYYFSCIRCAEIAYQFNKNGNANHDRPNNGEIPGGENMTYKGKFVDGIHSTLATYSSVDAFSAWIDSRGHRETIEDVVGNITLARLQHGFLKRKVGLSFGYRILIKNRVRWSINCFTFIF